MIGQWIDYLLEKQRWVIHVLFWMLVLALYVLFFGHKDSNYLQTSFFVGLLMPVTIAATYFINYYLIPHYLVKERYGPFIVYFFYTLVGAIFLESSIAMLTFLIIAGASINEMSPASIDIFFLLAALLMVVFFGVAIKMVSYWRQSKEDYEKLTREKVEAELRFLKTQLNPHFLFNTLNNLFYLAQEKSDRAPKAILALSEILDYVMHSGQQRLVPLATEWQQAQNYLALELLRYEDRVAVTKQIDGDINRHTIGPMMLITLLENAFKHGAMNRSGENQILISLTAQEDAFHFLVRNDRPLTEKSKGHGIGLSNLKNQLAHLYPNQHTLWFEESDPAVFSVTLTIRKAK